MAKKISVNDISPAEVGDRGSIKKRNQNDLYEKRKKIHPKSIEGFFENIRSYTVWVTMLGYLILPWINWSGQQAIRFDLPGRKFNIVGITFWPQDFILLSWLMIIGFMALFLVTTVAGRAYCGYVCPQTTWTRFFMWIEEFTEGSRNQRIKLDNADLDSRKFSKRLQKHFLWILLSLTTGFTFVGYFVPVKELVVQMAQFQMHPWAVFWGFFFSGATYLNAGWMREQVCMYMCPYARFQSAMFDSDTLIVSYDIARGEPRALKRKEDDEGDCVDCELCVQVCPTGIDIRDGLQYECITCASCIDACDQVMRKYKKPEGLIRYTTENALGGKGMAFLRPKVLVFGAVMLMFSFAFMTALVTRVPLELDIIRERGQLYRYSSAGDLENLYHLKIMNMSQRDDHFAIEILEDNFKLIGDKEVKVHSGEILSLPVRLVSMDPESGRANQKVHFKVSSLERRRVKTTEESRFIGPSR